MFTILQCLDICSILKQKSVQTCVSQVLTFVCHMFKICVYHRFKHLCVTCLTFVCHRFNNCVV
jgi:hypothetical protein